MIQGKMLGRLLSLLVDEDNHRVPQKAASPSGWAGEGLEQMVVTVLVLFSNSCCRLLGRTCLCILDTGFMVFMYFVLLGQTSCCGLTGSKELLPSFFSALLCDTIELFSPFELFKSIKSVDVWRLIVRNKSF